MDLFNWQEIATESAKLLVGAGFAWLVQMRRELSKVRADLNAAFQKIRDLEDEVYFDQ